MAEYSGMSHGAEELVIVGDTRLAIQQSLGVIACRKDSLMTLLNRHRELVVKLKSVRYLYVSKVAKAVLNDHRKTEPKELNRIQEMI
ncbi:hypothetical protein PHMEG_00011227 [Phytophthora megakarya]|uniref:RNase H type-1 domain-containing protein n=1 Tax=Phytophthora megakarya TaxID=4795 RepID=A0A225WBQ8_9STRA|nr:hypothetical protein PHMEG_00011227 [Phytophthora megakarya]